MDWFNAALACSRYLKHRWSSASFRFSEVLPWFPSGLWEKTGFGGKGQIKLDDVGGAGVRGWKEVGLLQSVWCYNWGQA